MLAPALEWPAMTVRQPWAELIVNGRKSIEIRSWSSNYRGGMWVHAGLKRNIELERRFGFRDLYRGGFVGSVQLVAIVPVTHERWMKWSDKHLDVAGYREGLVAWMLESPQRFLAPVPGKGELGLFTPSPDLIEQLREADSRVRQGG
jgi:ASCH domain